jgi:signal peptidase I
MNKTEYLKIVDHRKSTLKTNSFDESMDTILIPEGAVFIIGDQWWRSFDSRLFGPIPLDTILGKVMGRTEG